MRVLGGRNGQWLPTSGAATDAVSEARVQELTLLVLTDHRAAPTFVAELAKASRSAAVRHVRDVDAAVEAAADVEPVIVLVDVNSLSRVDDLVELRARSAARITVLSALPAATSLPACMAAGASGFLCKPVTHDLLNQAVAWVARGHSYVDPRCTSWLVSAALWADRAKAGSDLTPRQAQVVQLLRGGLTNRQIAAALGVSAETVKSHVYQAMRRLGAHRRSDAVALMDRWAEDRP